MSTRCNIILLDEKHNRRIFLYHHHDGYPQGVGADLAHYVSEWNKLYLYEIEDYANRLIKGMESPFYGNIDNGYRLTPCVHSDIEFLYIIRFGYDDEAEKYTAVLECYKIPFSIDEEIDSIHAVENPNEIIGISVKKTYPLNTITIDGTDIKGIPISL